PDRSDQCPRDRQGRRDDFRRAEPGAATRRPPVRRRKTGVWPASRADRSERMTLDDETTSAPETRPRSRRRAASRPAGPPATETAPAEPSAPAEAPASGES